MKKDIVIKLSIGLVCILIISVGVFLITYNDEKHEDYDYDNLLLKDNLSFEINSELSLYSLISEDNRLKIISKDEEVDTSKLGEQEVSIRYLKKAREMEHNFVINIIDTTKPKISYDKELTTSLNQKINLLKDVVVTDNSKENIKATVVGKYNIKKEGKYNLKYVAIDSSNNKTEEDFILIVTKKNKTTKTTTTTTKKVTTTTTEINNTSEYTLDEIKNLVKENEPDKYSIWEEEPEFTLKQVSFEVATTNFYWKWYKYLKETDSNGNVVEDYKWVVWSDKDNNETGLNFPKGLKGVNSLDEEPTGHYLNAIKYIGDKPTRDGEYPGEIVGLKKLWYYTGNYTIRTREINPQ